MLVENPVPFARSCGTVTSTQKLNIRDGAITGHKPWTVGAMIYFLEVCENGCYL